MDNDLFSRARRYDYPLRFCVKSGRAFNPVSKSKLIKSSQISRTGILVNIVIVLVLIEAQRVVKEYRSRHGETNPTALQNLKLFEGMCILLMVAALLSQAINVYDVAAFSQILRDPAYRIPGYAMFVVMATLQFLGEVPVLFSAVLKYSADTRGSAVGKDNGVNSNCIVSGQVDSLAASIRTMRDGTELVNVGVSAGPSRTNTLDGWPSTAVNSTAENSSSTSRLSENIGRSVGQESTV
ncbi:hypothetical protein HK102_007220 [Quaeritorhiza haematococci]|nr:hypothetical protein HK102_007220 [Quaeritorhiza haematococci]